MARSFKILGLIVLTFLIVWAIVIIQWQQTRRMPDTRDIVLYLVALPIGLLLMFWGLKTGIDRMRQPPPAVEASADSQAAATEQAQAAQAQALLQAAPVISSSAKDLAQAQALARRHRGLVEAVVTEAHHPGGRRSVVLGAVATTGRQQVHQHLGALQDHQAPLGPRLHRG